MSLSAVEILNRINQVEKGEICLSDPEVELQVRNLLKINLDQSSGSYTNNCRKTLPFDVKMIKEFYYRTSLDRVDYIKSVTTYKDGSVITELVLRRYPPPFQDPPNCV